MGHGRQVKIKSIPKLLPMGRKKVIGASAGGRVG